MTAKIAAQAAVPRTITDLLGAVELTRVVSYKLTAERVRNDVEAVGSASRDLEARVRVDERQLETRFTMTVEAPGARYVADIGTIYEFTTPVVLPLPSHVVGEFIGQVGIMAAFPYLREAVSGLAARLGAEIPVMGLIRRGELAFGVDDSTIETPVARRPVSQVEAPGP